jgi:hypothetical protein
MTVTAHLLQFDNASCINVFAKDKEAVESIEEEEDTKEFGKIKILSESYSDNSSLEVCGNYLSYTTPQYQKIINTFFDDDSLEEYNADKYATGNNLEFMSITDAKNQIYQTLISLGIELSEQFTCYTLDYKTMQKEEILYDKWGDIIEDGSKTSWSEEDSCYIFDFQQEYNGMVINSNGYGDYLSGGLNGTTIRVIYGQHGIIDCSIDGVLEFEDTTEDESIISLDQAVEVVKDKFDLIIQEYPLTIKKIDLEMLPITDKKDYTQLHIIPAWKFEVIEDIVDTDGNQVQLNSQILINGLNAKEIY